MSLSDKDITAKNFQEFYNRIKPFLNQTAPSGFTPIGTIISVMGKKAPENYLACDGTAYNILEYPELAVYIKDQFGSYNYFGGDGTNTFAVPDLRGEFLRGTGTNSHANQGSGGEVGEHQNGTSIPSVQGSGAISLGIATLSDADYFGPYIGRIYVTSSKTDEWGSIFIPRPTNTSVLYCIAYKNIFIDVKQVYSLNERVVGTWINGKPLYQKCYQGTFPSTLGLGIDIGNISDILGYAASDVAITKIIGVVNWSVGSSYGTVSIPYYLENTDVSGNTGNWLSLYTDESVGKIKANIGTTSPVKNCPYTLTIQYTKTTD